MAPVEVRHDTLLDANAAALPVKNVLFATDFSPTSEAALPYAAAICRRFGATLHLAHVLSDASLLMMTGGVDYVSMGTLYDDAQNEAKERLELVSLQLGGVPHQCYVRHGAVWKNLAGIVGENQIDMIVVGTHGRTGLGKLLLGSVAEDILRHAACPVLTVGPKISGHAKIPGVHGGAHDVAPADLDLRQIVFATNFAPNAARAVAGAVSLAQEFHSRLTLLHVLEHYTELGSEPAPIEASLRRLLELVPANATLHYAPERTIEFGNPSEQILKVAAQQDADLIVLGARSNIEVGTTHLPWSTTHHVLAKAHCPVLTVRD
jgi:nucleotide-binding universal stress UspA family protein